MFHENLQIGPYTLIRKLGRGGFGEVWLAERRAKFVTTKVAVKLPVQEQVDPEAIRQEATLWEKASGHPNVLPIIDADEYDGQIVIVSEYAPDGSLDQWLKQNGPMPVPKAIYTMIDVLSGLEFLHSRHIIHRDLKPANILLQGETPRLTDFGISRAIRTTVSSQSKNVSGTFAYMAPEAFDGKRSVQTDVWSAGVNLYRFLTGKYPYPQKEPTVLIAAIMMEPPEPLPDGIPPEVQAIIAKALAKVPENRYSTAAEMREDLRAVAVEKFDRRATRREAAPAAVALNAPAAETMTRTSVDRSRDIISLPPERGGAGRFFLALIGVLLAIGGALAVFYYFGAPQKTENNQGVVSPTPSSNGVPQANPVRSGGLTVSGGEVERGGELERSATIESSNPENATPHRPDVNVPNNTKIYQPANRAAGNTGGANTSPSEAPPPSRGNVSLGEPYTVNSATRNPPTRLSNRAANQTMNSYKKPE